MFKLLRNLVLAAILLAGALKLLAWYAVGQDAGRMTAAVAPYAELKYDGLSAGLDGSVTFNNVTVTQVPSHRVFRADSVSLQTPGLYWLLKHTLLHENEWPTQLGLNAQGLHFPALPGLDAQFVDPTTWVPFAAVGCGAPFTANDYRRMIAPPAVTSGQANYRYQPDTHIIEITSTLTTPGYSSLTLHGDLHPFDPGAMTRVSTWEKLHSGQLGADYSDDGFMTKRNAFCAQRLGVSAAEFSARHVAAVQALLAEHHVEPSGELMQLYRNLSERGGSTSVLSLPRSTFVLSNWESGSPDDLLRQLNITARYRDTPPVMFRLSFVAPAPGEANDVAAVGASVTPAAAIVTPAPVATAPPPPPPAIPPTVAATAAPAPAPVESIKPRKPSDNLGLRELDRVEAKLATKPAPPLVTPVAEPALPAETETELASSPPPPANSTLALVWKPTVERLPPPPPAKLDYEVIDYTNLQNAQGRHVRLITEGNKRIEGYVIGADAGAVRLRVGRSDGDAQFEVPRKRILQVQLLRHAPPA